MAIREYVTILLFHTPETETRQFRCIDCGKVVFEYRGDVANIIPGEPADKMIGGCYECNGEKELCVGGEWTQKRCDECGKHHKVCVNGSKVTKRCNMKYWVT